MSEKVRVRIGLVAGIDVSKAELVVAFRTLRGEVKELTVSNDAAGHKRLVELLAKKQRPSRVIVELWVIFQRCEPWDEAKFAPRVRQSRAGTATARLLAWSTAEAPSVYITATDAFPQLGDHRGDRDETSSLFLSLMRTADPALSPLGTIGPDATAAFASGDVNVFPVPTRRILDGLRRATGPPGPGAVGDDRRA